MTNLELNRWAHGFLGLCWHELGPKVFDPSDKSRVGNVCPKCRHFFRLESQNLQRPDYCSDLNLAAKVEAAAVDGIKVTYSNYEDILFEIIATQYPPDEWKCFNNSYIEFLRITADAPTRVRACYAAMEGK
jgi:hypothetical protein